MKTRAILLVVVAISVAIIMLLPRYVVDTTIDSSTDEQNMENAPAELALNQAHEVKIPDSVVNIINLLRDKYINDENQEKRFIFADSLAKAFQNVNVLDSAAKYIEAKASIKPSAENMISAGDGYYAASDFAIDRKKKTDLSAKAREYYQRVLEKDKDNVDVRAKLAMTLVSTENPMMGIRMLQEILAQNPDHELTIFNLGLLAISSGQFDKGIERFERLIELNEANMEAHFYLGYCLLEKGENEMAKLQFDKVVQEGTPELAGVAKEYLNIIN